MNTVWQYSKTVGITFRTHRHAHCISNVDHYVVKAIIYILFSCSNKDIYVTALSIKQEYIY